MSNKIIMVSESADLSSSPAGAMVACLATLVLDINDNPIAEFRTSYREWYTHAKSFASRFGFGPQFKEVSNRLMKGDDIYGDDEDVLGLGKAIRTARKDIYGDTNLSKEVFKLIMAGARCLIKDDASAWSYIEKNISYIRETRLTSIFLPEDDEPIEIDGLGAKSASMEMKKAYKALMGSEPKYGYFVSPIGLPQLREKNPKAFEEYSRLAKILNKETKRLVFRFVRNSGKEMVPVDAVSKFLDSQGMLHNMPRGFIGGQVDENMNFYTAEGRQLDKKPSGLVKMNPKYDPAQDNTYVLYVMGYGERVGAGRIRTIEMNKSNKVQRHAAVEQFLDSEDKIRAKWVRDLSRKGTKEQIMAAMVELMYATSARIGGKGNQSAGEKTYGLTTLEVQHVSFKGTKLLFNYIGKKGAPQPASYMLNTAEAKRVGEIVKKLMEDKQPSDLLFTFRDRPILRHSVNKYVKTLGTTMSAHGFRRVAGTKAALQLLAKNPFTGKAKTGEVKEADVNRWFKKEMEKVGEVLHHRNGEKVTGMTAVKSYIDPGVIENFYTSLNLRVPSFVPSTKTKE